MHKPVLFNEAIDMLSLSAGKLIIDCTLGGAGHAKAILERITPGGFLIGIDKDQDAINRTADILKGYKGSFKLVHSDFRYIKQIIDEEDIKEADGILFDLGVSSFQLDEPGRGFSFSKEGPLDMRMDISQGSRVSDLINRLPENRLADIIYEFGEERCSRRIARAIVDARHKGSIKTTTQLRDIVTRAIPGRLKHARMNPATRTFQALRIAVNDELAALSCAISDIPACLKFSGRVCVISFHSLEDRIVKNSFKNFEKSGIFRLINKKPVTPSSEEIISNPKSRSAKLRAAEKII